MRTEAIYGQRPRDLGRIGINPEEMMCWLYCPIKLPGMQSVSAPDNLRQFRWIWEEARKDCADRWDDSCVYVTAKTLWVTPENPGNRPGWHSDGFLTDDLNYIWADRAPTVFYNDWKLHAFTADHTESLAEMDDLCENRVSAHHWYPDKHLLRLDETVLHKTPSNFAPGMRTFVKISVSQHRYALRGNSINWAFGLLGEYGERGEERNCPIKGSAANAG